MFQQQNLNIASSGVFHNQSPLKNTENTLHMRSTTTLLSDMTNSPLKNSQANGSSSQNSLKSPLKGQNQNKNDMTKSSPSKTSTSSPSKKVSKSAKENSPQKSEKSQGKSPLKVFNSNQNLTNSSPSKQTLRQFTLESVGNESEGLKPAQLIDREQTQEKSDSMTSMFQCLPVANELSAKPVKPTILDQRDNSELISDILELDDPLLNFDTFISGKLLGSTLNIRNKSNKPIVFNVSVYSNEFKKPLKHLFQEFYSDDLPFNPEQICNGKPAMNQNKNFCLEDPETKKFIKQLTVKLQPGQEMPLVVILKTPYQQMGPVVSALKFSKGAYTQKDLQKCQKRTLENAMTVLVCGHLENPKVKCLKSIYNSTAAVQTIPLALSTNQPLQKFKLPFTSSLIGEEHPFEFMFIKTVKTDDNEDMCRAFECMVFFCQPSVLPLVGGETGILNVQIKLDVDKLNALPRSVLKAPLSKLLIARLKDTNLLQSYYVTLQLIETQMD